MRAPIRLLMIATAAVAAATAAAAPLRGIQVNDLGQDGDERFYDIRCPDDRRIVISHDPDRGQVCFYADAAGEKTCLKTNDLDAAAGRSCSMKKE